MTVCILDIPQGSRAWHDVRRTRYGASTLAPIAGIESYQTAAEVWRAMLGRPVERSANELARRIGHALEPLALDLAREALGPTTLRGAVLCQERGWLLASLDDALDAAAPEPIDAKVRGAGSPDHSFYQEETIPFSTALQLTQQAALIAELVGRWPEAAHVSAFLGGRWGWEHHLYRLEFTAERREEWADVWAPYAGRWHWKYVAPYLGQRVPEPGEDIVPPDATMQDVAVLVEPTKVRRREATEAERALVEKLAVAEAERKTLAAAAAAAEKARDKIRNALVLSLGTSATVPGVCWATRKNLDPILKLETT